MGKGPWRFLGGGVLNGYPGRRASPREEGGPRRGVNFFFAGAARLPPPSREIAEIVSGQTLGLRTPFDRLTVDGIVELYSRGVSGMLYAAAAVAQTRRHREVTEEDLRGIYGGVYEKEFFVP